MIYPLSWDVHGVKECAFASVCTVGTKKAVYVMMHILDGDQYVIENHWFGYDDGTELPTPDGMMPEVRTGSTIPLFQIIMPNIVNTADLDSPLGISVFACATDVIL